MFDRNPAATFGYVASELKRRKIAYMHVSEPRIKGNAEIQDGLPSVRIRSNQIEFLRDGDGSRSKGLYRLSLCGKRFRGGADV